MEQILAHGVFNPNTTLTQEIEELSDPLIEIETSRIANLVVKYLTNFKHSGWLEDVKLSWWDINCSYNSIIKEIWPGSIKKLMRKYFWTSYQELMLACPSTISIIQDIISLPVHDVLGNKSHYIIDAWSWSWILQVAFYIQARRSWLLPNSQTSRWIELNTKAQRKSNKILNTLKIWHVMLWDSLSREHYTSLNTEFIHSYGNENIVDSLVYEWWEPFIDNLRVLASVYPDTHKDIQLTPHGLIFMVSQSARDTSSMESNMPVISFNGDIENFLNCIEKRIAIAQKHWNKINDRELFFPSDIKITPLSKMYFLERLGQEHIWKIFTEHTLVKNFDHNPATRWKISAWNYVNSIKSKS